MLFPLYWKIALPVYIWDGNVLFVFPLCICFVIVSDCKIQKPMQLTSGLFWLFFLPLSWLWSWTCHLFVWSCFWRLRQHRFLAPPAGSVRYASEWQHMWQHPPLHVHQTLRNTLDPHHPVEEKPKSESFLRHNFGPCRKVIKDSIK